MSLSSPLPGVSNEAWAKFVRLLETQDVRSKSASGGFGAYDMRPKRLAELGIVRLTGLGRNHANRQHYECEFIAPWNRDKFLSDPRLQYRVLVMSMERYAEDIRVGKVTKPADISLSGALAILHRGMTGALKSYPNLFSDTRRLLSDAQGVF